MTWRIGAGATLDLEDFAFGLARIFDGIAVYIASRQG